MWLGTFPLAHIFTFSHASVNYFFSYPQSYQQRWTIPCVSASASFRFAQYPWRSITNPLFECFEWSKHHFLAALPAKLGAWMAQLDGFPDMAVWLAHLYNQRTSHQRIHQASQGCQDLCGAHLSLRRARWLTCPCERNFVVFLLPPIPFILHRSCDRTETNINHLPSPFFYRRKYYNIPFILRKSTSASATPYANPGGLLSFIHSFTYRSPRSLRFCTFSLPYITIPFLHFLHHGRNQATWSPGGRHASFRPWPSPAAASSPPQG